jgi:hypothetical protein
MFNEVYLGHFAGDVGELFTLQQLLLTLLLEHPANVSERDIIVTVDRPGRFFCWRHCSEMYISIGVT